MSFQLSATAHAKAFASFPQKKAVLCLLRVMSHSRRVLQAMCAHSVMQAPDPGLIARQSSRGVSANFIKHEVLVDEAFHDLPVRLVRRILREQAPRLIDLFRKRDIEPGTAPGRVSSHVDDLAFAKTRFSIAELAVPLPDISQIPFDRATARLRSKCRPISTRYAGFGSGSMSVMPIAAIHPVVSKRCLPICFIVSTTWRKLDARGDDPDLGVRESGPSCPARCSPPQCALEVLTRLPARLQGRLDVTRLDSNQHVRSP